MRVVFSLETFSEQMGYHENVIPRTIAEMGHEVYVVSSTMQVYGDQPSYDEVYGGFLGPRVLPAGRKSIGPLTLIRLPILMWWKRFRLARGRLRTIRRLKPDIVYAYDPKALQTVALSLASRFSSYRFFVAAHTVASVYPAYYRFSSWPLRDRLRLRLTNYVPGWICGLGIERCFAVTRDAAEIAHRFFGLSPGRIDYIPLPLDISWFTPVSTADDAEERRQMRARFGYADSTVVFVFSGRLTAPKNPVVLAQAVAALRARGRDVAALFVGTGEQAAAIQVIDGSTVVPFAPYLDLRRYYRAADAGVWPVQESNSNLDAAACGLPIVVSERMHAADPIPGRITYDQQDPEGLARTLERLLNPEFRRQLGAEGAAAMRSRHSHVKHAEHLVRAFEAATARDERGSRR